MIKGDTDQGLIDQGLLGEIDMLIKNAVRVERTDRIVLMVDNAVLGSGLKGNLGFRTLAEMQACIDKLQSRATPFKVLQAFVRNVEMIPDRAYLVVLDWDPQVQQRAALYERHGCIVGFDRELEARQYFGKEPEILHVLAVG